MDLISSLAFIKKSNVIYKFEQYCLGYLKEERCSNFVNMSPLDWNMMIDGFIECFEDYLSEIDIQVMISAKEGEG